MKTQTILLAVGRPDRYEWMLGAFGDAFTTVSVDNRWEADAAVAQDPDILIVEDVLPGGRGLKICQRARLRPGGARRRIMVVGDSDRAAIDEAMAEGIVDAWVPRDVAPGAFLSTFWAMQTESHDRRTLEAAPDACRLLATTRSLFGEVERGIDRGALDPGVRRLLTETASAVVAYADSGSVSTLLGALQEHHAYTFAHSLRVGLLMAMFGRHLGLDEAHVGLMAETGLAHDLGKLSIPVAILAKPGRLTSEEMAVMRTHSALGSAMLEDVYRDHAELVAAVRHHHEQLSGAGYPDGLRGAQIDELSLLTAVVDVYTALTDRRDYKAAMPSAAALAVMDGIAGSHLEPRLYRRFREVAGGLARPPAP